MSLDTADVADGGSIDDTPPHVRTPAAGMDGPPPTAGAARANVRYQPSDEQCDNNDNDCDGKVDEGLIESCDDANLLGECKPPKRGLWLRRW